MTIKVYVDWSEEEIINEAEYEKILKEEVKELMDDNWEFNCWLGEVEGYSLADIFHFSDKDKQKVRAAWEKQCTEDCRLNGRFEERIIEV